MSVEETAVEPSSAPSRAEEAKIYLVANIRCDLSTEGFAAFGAIATCGAFRIAKDAQPEEAEHYFLHNQPKICIRVKSDGHLLRSQRECVEAGLPCCLAHTEGGQPAILAVGPVTRKELPAFVGKHQLLGAIETTEGVSCRQDYGVWLLMRQDLEMPSGKVIPQAGHGMLTLMEDALKDPALSAAWTSNLSATALWVEGLQEMNQIIEDCARLGLPTAVIIDEGRTILTGKNMTVTAVGPCMRDALPHSLKLPRQTA